VNIPKTLLKSLKQITQSIERRATYPHSGSGVNVTKPNFVGVNDDVETNGAGSILILKHLLVTH
jgi:hypothetical protein